MIRHGVGLEHREFGAVDMLQVGRVLMPQHGHHTGEGLGGAGIDRHDASLGDSALTG